MQPVTQAHSHTLAESHTAHTHSTHTHTHTHTFGTLSDCQSVTDTHARGTHARTQAVQRQAVSRNWQKLTVIYRFKAVQLFAFKLSVKVVSFCQ